MAVTGVESTLLELLVVFVLAAAVGIAVAKVGRFPYTIALLLAGLAVSVIGVDVDIELSHDLILLVLLPPLLFEGAATTDLEQFRRDLLPIVALAVPGLLVSIAVLGGVGYYAFGFPLLVALLFAAMILQTPDRSSASSGGGSCSLEAAGGWAVPFRGSPSPRNAAMASSTAVSSQLSKRRSSRRTVPRGTT